MKYMSKIQILMKVQNYILLLLFFGLVLCSFLQVFFRYTMNLPLSWTEESSRYFLIWVAFLGGGIAFAEKAHLGVDIIVARFPYNIRKVVKIVVDALIVLFAGIIFKEGVGMIKVNMVQTSPALGVPMGYIYAAIPIGFLYIGIVGILNLVKTFQTSEENGEI